MIRNNVSNQSSTGIVAGDVVRVTDRTAARHVLLNPELFSPANALEAVTPIHGEALRVLAAGRFSLPPALATLHGRAHRERRKALAGLFTSAAVADLEGFATQRVQEQVSIAHAELAATGRADLVASVAGPPPTQVMLRLFGWKHDDVPTLKRWSDRALELFWGWPTPTRQVELAHDCVSLHRWLRESVLDRPNALTQALSGVEIPEAELLALAFFLAIAGHQTTTYLGAAALEWVLSRPGAWAAAGTGMSSEDHASRSGGTNAAVAGGCRTDAGRAVRGTPTVPGRVTETADEGVREWAGRWAQAALAHRSSVHTWRRVATGDGLAGDVPVRAGTQVVVELTGSHPGESDDIPAAQDYQLAFGVGLHRCLGAALAEMELRVMLEQTRLGLPHIRPVATIPVSRVNLLSFSAPRQVVVEGT